MSHKLYPPQDAEQLGDVYFQHLEAMTAEGLHEKRHIAAQLAWRDILIQALRDQLSAPLAPPAPARDTEDVK